MHHTALIFGTICCAIGLVACGGSTSPLNEAASNVSRAVTADASLLIEPLPVRSSNSGSGTLFTKLAAEETGVSFQNTLDLNHPLKRLYHSGFICGGVAAGDLDGDDLPELFFASGPGENRLYRQNGSFTFEDVTEATAIDGGDDWGTGVAFVDVDGDGDLDIYVCNYDSANTLFLNETKSEDNAPMQFREAAAEFGLDLVDASLMPSFCDYDNDGDLDCWVLTNRLYREGGRPERPPVDRDPQTGEMTIKPEFAKYYGVVKTDRTRYSMDEVARPDYLLRNDGGKFKDVSVEAGISVNGFGLSATWWDYDRDGDMDIYVCNDFLDPDRLFRNNGDGTFTDAITETVNATPWFSMGSDVGDINNDGLLDFVALDMAATNHYKSKMAMGEMGSMRWPLESVKPRQLMRNVCYLNTGTARMIETAQLSGISNSDWSWAAKLADFDSDGRLDLFVSNGMARDFNNSDIAFDKSMLIGKTQWEHYEDTPTKPEQNLAFQNVDGLKFEDVSGDWGLDHTGMSYGTAYGDLDRDGDLDLVVVNLDEPASVYRNDSQTGNAVVVQLRGKGKNRHGLGAKVQLETTSGALHVRQLVPATGFLSSNVPELVIGLGEETAIAKLTVNWPSGTVQHFHDLSAGNRITIAENQDSPTPAPAASAAPLFARSKTLDGLVHRERIYEDFVRQPLLPNKLSQLGPGFAWADVDGDGDDDMFVGAARSMSGAIVLNDGVGPDGVCQFHVPSEAPFKADAERENMGALFFDADSDGDMDLYVANGSYEYDEDDYFLGDNFYLNDGTGKFESMISAIPGSRDSSSCVVGADFDRDGDVDLFVGGRVIPGKYPEAARSHLLLNETVAGGDPSLVAADEAIAPGLQLTGLVTGALWSDVDNDGWIDLLVTCEWGPIMLFQNQQGVLKDRTEEAGLSDLLGWWNGIAGADLDHDGDIDYAVTNFGLNTKYHASKAKPTMLYYGDYAGDGKMSLVEAKYEDDVLLPIRGKSCSTRAMPHLAQRFDTFHKFAIAALPEIYAPESLESALKLSVNTLESGILINDGTGHFDFVPLPAMAQVSPAFGVSFLDANADGHSDLVLAHNFFTPQFETGPYSSGLGCVLLGNGQGEFAPLMPSESGLIIPGDAKALAVVDLNRDGRLDLAVTQNNGALLTFESTQRGSGRFLKVRLKGSRGNPEGLGARVIAHLESGDTVTHEVHGGSGYLSQSPTAPVLALGDRKVVRIEVRWPDGEMSEIANTTAFAGEIVVSQP